MSKEREKCEGSGYAYLLIQTAPGKALGVLKALKKTKGVFCANAVTGPYDIIACAGADDLDALGKFVVSKVQGIPGIQRTTTCLAVDV